MSRLAEAFRKASAAGRASLASRQPPSTWDIVPVPFAGARLPWDRTRPIEREGDAVHTPRPGSAERLTPARRAGRATAGAGGDLAALLRQIYEPGTVAGQRRAILFSAVDADRSCARLSVAIAAALSDRTGASVCLLEADLRSPSLHELCDQGVGPGLAEMLLEGRALGSVIAPVSTNLWLLPAGLRRKEALQRLTAEQLQPCIDELRVAFDYLVVNASAVTADWDAALLAPLVDGVVLVVAAGDTRREAGRWTVEQLQRAGANVLGAVLADRTFP